MKSRLLVVAVAASAMLVSCGGGGDGEESIEGESVVVDLFDNRYEYTEIVIPVGGAVTWSGAGRNPHNAVAADGSWTTEAVFGSLDQFDGDDAMLTYDTPGVYAFFCTYHGNAEGDGMAGTLTVG